MHVHVCECECTACNMCASICTLLTGGVCTLQDNMYVPYSKVVYAPCVQVYVLYSQAYSDGHTAGEVMVQLQTAAVCPYEAHMMRDVCDCVCTLHQV
jgi:hypothetical protein